MEKYKNNINLLRKKAGLTVQELADKSGYTRAYINQLKAGTKRLNSDVINKLSAVLKCAPSDLISEDDHEIDTNIKSCMRLVIKIAMGLELELSSIEALDVAESTYASIKKILSEKKNITLINQKKEI